MAKPTKVEVEVGGRQLTLSNLDKVLYPSVHFTKSEVIDYYARIAPVMVPHLAGRPITFKRYPDGVDGKYFFEKNAPSHTPEWVPTMTLSAGERDGASTVNYPRIEEPAALVWAANLAAIEIHPGLARVEEIRRPDHVVFDLDPGDGTDIVECCQVGLWLRDALDDLGLVSLAKTSGSKGLQVYVPLHTPCDFEDTRKFSLAVAQLLEKWHPELIVTTQEKVVRKDKVLIDWLQNASFKTTIGVYSLRAREKPTVSTPVTWDEVAAADFADDLRFEAADVLARVAADGDLWAEMLTVEQTLPGKQVRRRMDKVERLTNIVALLLTTRRPLTLDEIADEVGGYPDRGETRRAAFERDKKTLRAEGVPLEVVPQTDGGSAYRIDPDKYYLPELDLSDDERVALNLAVAAVNIEGDTGRDALWKLGEGGTDGPAVAALPTDDGLSDLFDAWRRRAPAFFAYRGEPREVHVWGVAFRNGRWYVVGHDAGKDGERLFRVDRIDAEVTVGEDGTATPVPAGFDLIGRLPGRTYNMYPHDDVQPVLVDIDAGWARGAISDLGEDAVVERRDDGSLRVKLHVTSFSGFRSWLYGYLDHAVVVEPQECVDDFVKHLRELAGVSDA